MMKPVSYTHLDVYKRQIWYQGEANTRQAYQYRELMPLMIKDWRDRWGYDFPFYMVIDK